MKVDIGLVDEHILSGHRIDELVDGGAHPVEHFPLVVADEEDLIFEEL